MDRKHYPSTLGSSMRPRTTLSDENLSGQVSEAEGPVNGQIQASGENSARLPPRSRTGCWTCRKRKVKCDEGRPVCNQCLRLSQTCDYGARLAWRDDTPKVMEKSQMSLDGCPTWHPHAAEQRLIPPRPVDDMPAFTTLKNETEREQKALWYPPGKFSVHTVPSTFSSLPEYRDDPEETTPTEVEPPGRHRTSSSSRQDSPSPERKSRAMGESAVLLERFEAPSDKPPPTSSPYSPLQRVPEAYYQQPYQAHRPQGYASYVNLPHRPSVDSTYHYQSGNFAASSPPQQYPANYQYAQAGIGPPYPQHAPRPYTEPSPLPYGSPPYSPTHQNPPAPHGYHHHHYSGHYNDTPPAMRSPNVPRQTPILPQISSYLPPAPNPYEAPPQSRLHQPPAPPMHPTGSRHHGGMDIGPGMGLEQYSTSGPGGYGSARYSGHGYYESESGGE